MTINYNVTGTERKRLADYISGFMGTEKKYLGAPTFAYQIGYLTVSKDGAVSFEDRGYNSDIDALMAELEGQGFHTEDTIAKADTTDGEDAAPEAAPAEEGVTQPHGFGLTVTLPAVSLPTETLTNLTSLLTAKGRLIRKALGVEAPPVEVSSDTVSFPWFEGRNLDADEVKTYTHLIAALCDMARNQKRITAKEKATDNDKYEQQNSYEAQVDYYTTHIQGNPEWIFAGVYSDAGITGTSMKKRDGFNQMVADALAGKIDLILTKSVSRFARNTVDSLTTVRKLKEKGVEVYFEKENIYTLGWPL